MQNVTISVKAAHPVYFQENMFSLFVQIVGMCSALWLSIKHLKLRSHRNGVKFLISNPLISPACVKLELVIP